MPRIKLSDELPPRGSVAAEMAAATLPDCDRVEFISTGCTVLNLAASGRALDGGWARGRIHNVVGDGSSGKTLAELEFMAYCYHRLLKRKTELYPKPKRLRLVYYNAENVMDFPVEAMYGEKFYKAVEWLHIPYVEDVGQHFFEQVVSGHKEGEVVVVVVDSWDALRSKEDAKRYEKNLKQAAKEDGEAKGSYNLGKQKYSSQYFFPRCCEAVQGKDITLGIISQVRDRIGLTFGEKQYRAGGAALNFYTHQVCWLAEKEKLVHTFKGHKRPYGIKVRARLKRNKCAMPFRDADFNIVFNYGIDDTVSMLEWLYGPKFTQAEFRHAKMSREALTELLRKDPEAFAEMTHELQREWLTIEEKVNPMQGRHKYDA